MAELGDDAGQICELFRQCKSQGCKDGAILTSAFGFPAAVVQLP